MPSQSAEQRYHDQLKLTLDALAKICVSEKQGQVVATTVSITTNPACVEIFISANTDLTLALHSSLPDYTTSIWASLKEISKYHSEESPIAEKLPSRERSAINELGTKVYGRCHAKFFHTLKKHFEEFERFSAFLDEREKLPILFDAARNYVRMLNDIASGPNPPS